MLSQNIQRWVPVKVQPSCFVQAFDADAAVMRTVATVLDNAGVAGVRAEPRPDHLTASTSGEATPEHVTFQTWRQVEYSGEDAPVDGPASMESPKQGTQRDPREPHDISAVPQHEGCAICRTQHALAATLAGSAASKGCCPLPQ